MGRKDFKPPRYEGSLHVLFDKKTGQVLATEQRWTLLREPAEGESPALSELLKHVAKEAGKRAGEVDILVLRREGEIDRAVRWVDVGARRPVFEPAGGGALEGTAPKRLERP